MDRGIVYLLAQRGDTVLHAPCLLVSLWSMRRTEAWKGPVHITVMDDMSAQLASRIAQDERLQPLTISRINQQVRRNWAYYAKACIGEWLPYDEAIFLDADTVLSGGSIEEVFPQNQEEIVLTHFAGWFSNGRKMGGRIAAWNDICPSLVLPQLHNPYPAVNTGVFGVSKKTKMLKSWKSLCEAQERGHGRVVFMADELAAQLLFSHFPCRMLDARFNASVKFDANLLNVRVWHFHGRKQARFPTCFPVWCEAATPAWKDNVGGFQEWSEQHDPASIAILKRHLTCNS